MAYMEPYIERLHTVVHGSIVLAETCMFLMIAWAVPGSTQDENYLLLYITTREGKCYILGRVWVKIVVCSSSSEGYDSRG